MITLQKKNDPLVIILLHNNIKIFCQKISFKHIQNMAGLCMFWCIFSLYYLGPLHDIDLYFLVLNTYRQSVVKNHGSVPVKQNPYQFQ